MCGQVVCGQVVCDQVVCGQVVCGQVVCEQVVCGQAAGGEAGVHNQKQEPHTKMWGIKTQPTNQQPRNYPPVPLQEKSVSK